MTGYRRVKVGKYYKSRNPDNTYLYFKVIEIDGGIYITVLKDLDTIKARSFKTGYKILLPYFADMLSVSRCSTPLSEEEILAVMI